MNDEQWERLLARIASGYCTPFLGAGACAGTLPLGSEVAQRWAKSAEYPLEDEYDLGRVAQFVGVNADDPMWPKEKLCSELSGFGPPDYSHPDEPHAVLAELPLRVYVTTNYDDFMVQALRRAGKEPRQEICRWNSAVRAEPSAFDQDGGFVPTPEQPLVFHLHGRLDVPESIVLTEDDYLDFLVSVSRDQQLLPPQIQRSLSNTSLLFMGYRLADWDFRVLHRGLVMTSEQSLRRLSVAVQLPPSENARAYLSSYFGAMSVLVYWGTARDFAAELHERWSSYEGRGRAA